MEKTRLLHCSFTNQSLLYSSYMPFVQGGGLFLRTHESFYLGTPVRLSVRLMEDPETYFVDGKIVWITPRGAQGNKLPGIGVQFKGENSPYLCNKIETYLANRPQSLELTDTI